MQGKHTKRAQRDTQSTERPGASRRRILQAAGLLSAGAAFPFLAPRAVTAEEAAGCPSPASAASAGRVPGIQTYMVRDALARDAEGTLRALADMGYRELELIGLGGEEQAADSLFFGLSAERFMALASELGLSAPCAHVNGEIGDPGRFSELAAALGIQYAIEALAPEFIEPRQEGNGGGFNGFGPASRREVIAIAERLNRRGEEFEDMEIQFAYHNHDLEFQTLGDERIWDILTAYADVELVKIELDVGWVSVAGADPVAELQRLSGRVSSVHLKDFDPSMPLAADRAGQPFANVNRLVPPGRGSVDFAAISRQLDADNVRHRFVEVDVSADSLADARFAYCHLAALA